MPWTVSFSNHISVIDLSSYCDVVLQSSWVFYKNLCGFPIKQSTKIFINTCSIVSLEVYDNTYICGIRLSKDSLIFTRYNNW